MKTETNKFGSGVLYEAEDIEGLIFTTCTACMSIYSEFLSWANAHKDRFTMNPQIADNIIVLSCQVTDLAVLNDICHLEKFIRTFPDKHFFIGGCLARRFDIELPDGVKRLENIKKDYQLIDETWMVDFADPFWVNEFDEYSTDEMKDGHLFRNMYSLRIGVGCKGKCKYCTIRTTRGSYYELNESDAEFKIIDKDIVLISDNPTAEQIKK